MRWHGGLVCPHKDVKDHNDSGGARPQGEHRGDPWHRQGFPAAHGTFNVEPAEERAPTNEQCQTQQEHRYGFPRFRPEEVGHECFGGDAAGKQGQGCSNPGEESPFICKGKARIWVSTALKYSGRDASASFRVLGGLAQSCVAFLV